ncbi:MAG: pitrilysin family protein [Calditrichota bacterium]
MFRSRSGPIIAIILLFGLMVSAGAGAPVPSLREHVRETTLANGLKVVVVERHQAPLFFALITFRVGSTIETLDHTGLSHFMEHMLFKGSKTLGTTDYKKEVPILKELEETAAKMRDLQILIGNWRFDMFEEVLQQTRKSLPPEVLEKVGASESEALQTALETLQNQAEVLPAEWQKTPWITYDNNINYWSIYLELLDLRLQILNLMQEQKQFIQQTALDQIYDIHGAQGLNAGTGYDGTTYMVGLPSNCLELWMFLESDRFQNPVFREFYSEREVIQEEARMYENEPDDVLQKIFMENAFVAHPYGRPIIGWTSDIQRTTRTDMENHFRRFYAPNNCQLTIVGDVNAEETFKMVKRYFSPWKSAEVAQEVLVQEPPQIGEKRIRVEFDAEPQMMMGFHVPAAPHPDYYALRMAEEVLSSGRTSRFYRNIFEKGLTAGSPGAWLGPSDRYPGVFILSGGPRENHTVEELETALLTELDNLKSELVNERELERIRNRYLRSQFDRLRYNRWLAFSISSAFKSRGDWKVLEDDFNRLMAVTPEDIQRVANKYFTSQNRTVASLVKPTEANPPVNANEEGANQ